MTTEQVDPFDLPGQWYRANLHCHTTVSDGEVDAAGRVAQYKAAGYDILAITDHHTTVDVEGLSGDGFLVVSGIEMHPACPGRNMFHMVGLGVPHPTTFPDQATPEDRIEAVRAAGGEVIFAHPRWSGHGLTEFDECPGCAAVEVFNSTCTKIGRGDSSTIWDQLLEAGRRVYAVAVDDCHRGRDFGMGWTMFRMPELTAEAMLQALRTGAFYSSCGPTIHDVKIADGKVHVKCSEAAEIHTISNPPLGGSLYADGGPVLREAAIDLRPKAKWVRVEVTAPDGTKAWTNPTWLG